MSATNYFQHGALALILALSASACGDDETPANQTECGAGTSLVSGECVADALCGSGTTLTSGVCLPDPTVPTTTYRQIEHLGRPGIAEALLITPALLAGYNATAPSFTGASAADVAAITGEVHTVLRAIYLGACLLNGVVGFTVPADGVKPSGVECEEVGGAIFVGDNPLTGTTLKPAVATAAQAYAVRVFGQFQSDVMRIDTAITSTYLDLCTVGAPSGAPLLCGGRTLNDDVIDITYFYLLAGATVPLGANTPAEADQSVALVSDGVFFSPTNSENDGIGLGVASPSFGLPDPTNRNQFHQSCVNCGTPVLLTAFPYSAKPR